MTDEPSVNPISPEAVALALATMPPDDLFDLMIETLEALADPIRARMLFALRQQPMSVRDLALVSRASESLASHQLRVLRKRGMVRKVGKGNVRLYSLADAQLGGILSEIERHVAARVSGSVRTPNDA